MADRPVVSVVIPTRNRSGLLKRAVDSVLDQSHPDWELFIVDDGSTDITPELVSRWGQADPRIRLIRMAGPVGGAMARNQGIAAANAPWIAFLDDDDQWLPTKLEDQLRVAGQLTGDTGLIYCPCLYVDAAGKQFLLQTSAVSGLNTRRALLRRNFISTPTVLVRRSLLEEVDAFDTRLPRLQDWDLWLRLAAITSFAYVSQPLARAHYTPGAISTRSDALVEACEILEEKFGLAGGLDRSESADFYHALGHILMIGGAPTIGPRYLWRSIRHRPAAPHRLVMGLLATFGSRPYLTVSRLHERLTRWRTQSTTQVIR